MAGYYGKSSRMSLNERFTHLRNSTIARDPVAEIRQTHYDEQQQAMRSRRVQMQMEQRPGVRAALSRARSRSRSRSRSRARYASNGSRPADIRDRLSFRRGRGGGRSGIIRGGGYRSRRDLSSGPPSIRRRSRSRMRRDSVGSRGGGRGARSRSANRPIFRARSRSRSRGRFNVNGRGGFRGGDRGRRRRSLSRNRLLSRNRTPRGGLNRSDDTQSLNKALGVPSRGGLQGRSRVRRDSLTNGVEFHRGGGGIKRGFRGGRGRDSGRGRGSIVRSRGRSRSIRDVGKYNSGLRGNSRSFRGSRRSRGGRGRGRGIGRDRPSKPTTNKDELDRELDQYMATDPLNSDKNLDAYRQDI